MTNRKSTIAVVALHLMAICIFVFLISSGHFEKPICSIKTFIINKTPDNLKHQFSKIMNSDNIAMINASRSTDIESYEYDASGTNILTVVDASDFENNLANKNTFYIWTKDSLDFYFPDTSETFTWSTNGFVLDENQNPYVHIIKWEKIDKIPGGKRHREAILYSPDNGFESKYCSVKNCSYNRDNHIITTRTQPPGVTDRFTFNTHHSHIANADIEFDVLLNKHFNDFHITEGNGMIVSLYNPDTVIQLSGSTPARGYNRLGFAYKGKFKFYFEKKLERRCEIHLKTGPDHKKLFYCQDRYFGFLHTLEGDYSTYFSYFDIDGNLLHRHIIEHKTIDISMTRDGSVLLSEHWREAGSSIILSGKKVAKKEYTAKYYNSFINERYLAIQKGNSKNEMTTFLYDRHKNLELISTQEHFGYFMDNQSFISDTSCIFWADRHDQDKFMDLVIMNSKTGSVLGKYPESSMPTGKFKAEKKNQAYSIEPQDCSVLGQSDNFVVILRK